MRFKTIHRIDIFDKIETHFLFSKNKKKHVYMFRDKITLPKKLLIERILVERCGMTSISIPQINYRY